MRIAFFCHSVLSDWNHGNAHFLRGVATELVARDHHVSLYEPRSAWSLLNLLAGHGTEPVAAFGRTYPLLRATQYDDAFDVEAALDDVDLVVVHEWNEPDLVARIGQARSNGGHFRLLFHDTHHRAISDPDAMSAFDLRHYDGVLAFGAVLRDIYLERGWTQRAWTWHEAADTRVFRPLAEAGTATDAAGATRGTRGGVVWIGNWGDEERSDELREFFIEPVSALGVRATVHGVRYPDHARELLARSGIDYSGWLPNFEVPACFARFRATVHVPRGPYARALPGIPTIRPFEALACGIPLVSAPWQDTEQLFRAGTDYLVAADGTEMRRCLRDLLNDDALSSSLATNGLDTILARHTCAHRVDELLRIVEELTTPAGSEAGPHAARAAVAAETDAVAVSP
jgi:spore maturation protein CgeB